MSWPLLPIKSVGKVYTGKTPSKLVPDYFGGNIPFVTPAELDKEIFVNSSSQTLTELGAAQIKLVPKNAIMVCCIGSLGKIGIAQTSLATNQQINSIVFDEAKVFPKYGFYACARLKPILESMAPATTVAIVNKSLFESLEIPIPPLPEQNRIAAILDKADSLRRKNQQAIQLADKFLRAVFLDMFGDPVTNPKGWDVKELKEGIISIKSGWSANGESIPCNSEQLGVLKISAVTSGVFKASENKYVPSETIPKNKSLIFPKKGDLLFSRANTRELVAATCIVPENNENVFLPDKLWKVETDKEKLLPEFLHYSIQQPRFRDLLTSQATGTSGSMLNISKAKFEETDIIFPDIGSQKKFAEIYWKIQNVFSKLNQSSVCSFDSFNSFSQNAFVGEL